MFKHQGKTRTNGHNLQIASILSFVAGMVNISGFLAIKKLTTNVTGHFAYFIDDFAKEDFWKGTIYLLYIVAFVVGSFTSSFLIELAFINKKWNVFVLPTILESSILILVALLVQFNFLTSIDIIACLLLFAMGVQNSLVTKISNAIVRTTHLTGLFTDLGIELSQLCFKNLRYLRKKIKSNIILRLFIITFFFMGGLFGGFLYSKIKFFTLIFAASILITGLVFDNLKFRLLIFRRKKRIVV